MAIYRAKLAERTLSFGVDGIYSGGTIYLNGIYEDTELEQEYLFMVANLILYQYHFRNNPWSDADKYIVEIYDRFHIYPILYSKLNRLINNGRVEIICKQQHQ